MVLEMELGPDAHGEHVVACRQNGSAVRIIVAVASILALVATITTTASSKRSSLRSSLLSWNNFADDGAGVLGGQQHGVSEIITSCDADDPGMFVCVCKCKHVYQIVCMYLCIWTHTFTRSLSHAPTHTNSVHLSNFNERICKGAVGQQSELEE